MRLPTRVFVLLPLSFAAITMGMMAAGCVGREVAGTGSGAPGGSGASPTTGPADNSPCVVCHMDLAEEPITIAHERGGIGCTGCHGTSTAHGGDELNIITPDRKFGRAEIAPFCTGCHPTHRKGKAYETFLGTWRGKRRPNGRMVLEDSVCTDCHGGHAILEADQLEAPGA